jgi:hypothetical protein
VDKSFLKGKTSHSGYQIIYCSVHYGIVTDSAAPCLFTEIEALANTRPGQVYWWVRVSVNNDCISRLVVLQDGHNPGHHCMMLFF